MHRKRTPSHLLRILFAASTVLLSVSSNAENALQSCSRPVEGAVVEEPPQIESRNGVLDLTLKFTSSLGQDGARRYCYLSDGGLQSPTLRVSPGDKVSIHFQNDMPVEPEANPTPSMPMTMASPGADALCNGAMSSASTNLHFHGLALPPVCHQDESVHTLVGPGQAFDYRFQIPVDSSPGLYWYHPNPHGFSGAQVQGGASGALIVQGIEAVIPGLRRLPQRTLILRDQLLPEAESQIADPLKPSWDVSVNYVPVKYPQYVPATIKVEPGKRQFWRLVNAAANTIFNLQILYNNVPQPVEVFAIDGVPLNEGSITEDVVFLPPGARAEFVLTTPSKGQSAQFVTLKYDPGPAGDRAPARPLANIVAENPKRGKGGAETPRTRQTAEKAPMAARIGNLLDLQPVRTRTLYFSQNGNGTEGGAGAATKYFITVVGQPVKLFDMAAPPNIVVRQGTVEDWNIENSTPEDHIFHIHQVHFQLLAINGVPVHDPVIRETILVPHQVGRTPISSVKLRMDFRDPNIVGNFVYHCHILDHEDKGMMGKIEVLPAAPDAADLSGAKGAMTVAPPDHK